MKNEIHWMAVRACRHCRINRFTNMKTLAIETIQEKNTYRRAFVKGGRNLKSYNTGVIGIDKRAGQKMYLKK